MNLIIPSLPVKKILEQLPYTTLHRLILVPLYTKATTLRRLLWRYPQKQTQIRPWESDLRLPCPFQRQIGVSLCSRVNDAGIRIAVDNYRDAVGDVLFDALCEFPAVGREEEVDGVVVQLRFATEVVIDQFSNGGCSICYS